MSRTELSKRLGQKKPTGQLYNVVKDLLNGQMIEYTLPETPRSRQQQYRLTEKGRMKLLNLRSRDAV
ncbi:ATP-dependent DNA helicase [Candidatus Poribacteria bacterium]|nr:ATP-dependent DNA helicase [Candidatus Poribacteria bacterium]